MHALLHGQGMTTQPVTYEPFPDADDLALEFEGQADVLNPVRGILVGILVCAPFWAAMYLVFRAMWG